MRLQYRLLCCSKIGHTAWAPATAAHASTLRAALPAIASASRLLLCHLAEAARAQTQAENICMLEVRAGRAAPVLARESKRCKGASRKHGQRCDAWRQRCCSAAGTQIVRLCVRRRMLCSGLYACGTVQGAHMKSMKLNTSSSGSNEPSLSESESSRFSL